MTDAKQRYIDIRKKNQLAGFLLVLLFGPLGLLYSNWNLALVLVLITVVTGGYAIMITWPLSLLCTFPCVTRYNEKLISHAELIQSTKN